NSVKPARLLVWDLNKHEKIELPTPAGSQKGATPVFLSAANRELLTIEETNGQFELHAWNLDARTNRLQCVLPLPGPRTASLLAPLWTMSSDRRWLARAAEQGNVHLWDMEASGTGPKVITGTGASITQLAFSPDGGSLAVGYAFEAKQ